MNCRVTVPHFAHSNETLKCRRNISTLGMVVCCVFVSFNQSNLFKCFLCVCVCVFQFLLSLKYADLTTCWKKPGGKVAGKRRNGARLSAPISRHELMGIVWILSRKHSTFDFILSIDWPCSKLSSFFGFSFWKQWNHISCDVTKSANKIGRFHGTTCIAHNSNSIRNAKRRFLEYWAGWERQGRVRLRPWPAPKWQRNGKSQLDTLVAKLPPLSRTLVTSGLHPRPPSWSPHRCQFSFIPTLKPFKSPTEGDTHHPAAEIPNPPIAREEGGTSATARAFPGISFAYSHYTADGAKSTAMLNTGNCLPVDGNEIRDEPPTPWTRP